MIKITNLEVERKLANKNIIKNIVKCIVKNTIHFIFL